MSWIYGASGGTNFWEEQIKNEKRLKKTWADNYGVDISSKRAFELQTLADQEAVDAAKLEAKAKATARPKLQKVPATWKTKCGPMGESRLRVPKCCPIPPPEFQNWHRSSIALSLLWGLGVLLNSPGVLSPRVLLLHRDDSHVEADHVQICCHAMTC